MRLALALAILAAPALAEPVDAPGQPVTAEEFEALVEGRTLTYGLQGAPPYGVERYHAGRRVTWAWLGEEVCHDGTWYPEGPAESPAICFVYDYDPADPKCWRFFRDGEALLALFLDEGGLVSYELVDDPGLLVCGGVGV